jgi:hypothetical protein
MPATPFFASLPCSSQLAQEFHCTIKFSCLMRLITLVVIHHQVLACADPLQWDKVKAFIPIVIMFYSVIWANMIALDTMSVDMVILFRCVMRPRTSSQRFGSVGRSGGCIKLL